MFLQILFEILFIIKKNYNGKYLTWGFILEIP